MQYTLAFDVYGTLIDTEGLRNKLEDLIGATAQDFLECWRAKQLEYSFRLGLMNTFVDFSVCTKDALVYTDRLFLTKLSEDQIQSLLKAYTYLPPFPHVSAGLKGVQSKGHRIYAFSNGSKKAVKQLLEHADLLHFFEGIISAEDVAVFKPSPKVYAHFVTQTASEKSKCWLISSNNFDVMGAQSFGMNSCWVKRSSKKIMDPWPLKPTATIRKLDQLSAVLDLYQPD